MANGGNKKVYDPIPKGDYTVALKEVRETKSKKGDDMVKVTFEVADGEHKGRLIWEHFMVSHSTNPDVPEFSANKAGRLLQAMGAGEDFEDIGRDYSVLENYQGRTVLAKVVTSEPYKGKDGSLRVGNHIHSFLTQ